MAKKKQNKFFSLLVLIIGFIVSGGALYLGMGLLSSKPSLFGALWIAIAIIALFFYKDKIFKN